MANILVLNAQIVVTPVNKKVTCCGGPPLINPIMDSFSISPFVNSNLYLFSLDANNNTFKGFILVNEDYFSTSGNSKILFSQYSYNYLDTPSTTLLNSQITGFKTFCDVPTVDAWCYFAGIRYMQLKYQYDSNIAYYGWLKLNYKKNSIDSNILENDTIFIEEYGMNTIPNEPILMGQTAPTTVQESIKKSNINVFPNPVSSIHHIQFENPSLNPCTIELYSIQGKKIKTIHHNNKEPNIDIQLDIIDIPNGLYFYKVIVDKKSEIILFNKQ